MEAVFQSDVIADFLKVISIDLMLAGDNVVVLGALASGLPTDQRKRVIGYGVLIALVLRIGFAMLATTLLKITGLLFAGGLLLLWVSWRLYREIAHKGGTEGVGGDEPGSKRPPKSFRQAIVQIALADLSMSLDNVLAVAGAARDHSVVLIFGLALSVALMGMVANFIARVIERHRWIAFVGLVIILWVAGDMILQGAHDLQRQGAPWLGLKPLNT